MWEGLRIQTKWGVESDQGMHKGQGDEDGVPSYTLAQWCTHPCLQNGGFGPILNSYLRCPWSRHLIFCIFRSLCRALLVVLIMIFGSVLSWGCWGGQDTKEGWTIAPCPISLIHSHSKTSWTLVMLHLLCKCWSYARSLPSVYSFLKHANTSM